jgi:hypothetical protein
MLQRKKYWRQEACRVIGQLCSSVRHLSNKSDTEPVIFATVHSDSGDHCYICTRSEHSFHGITLSQKREEV